MRYHFVWILILLCISFANVDNILAIGLEGKIIEVAEDVHGNEEGIVWIDLTKDSELEIGTIMSVYYDEVDYQSNEPIAKIRITFVGTLASIGDVIPKTQIEPLEKGYIVYNIENIEDKTSNLIQLENENIKNYPNLIDTFNVILELTNLNPIEAKKSFLQLHNYYPNSDLEDKILHWIGLCYYYEHNYIIALDYFQKVIDNITQTTKDSAAQYMIAKCHYKQEEYEIAQKELYKVISLYPNSNYAWRANLELKD